MSNEKFKISKWCIAYERENIIALFHALSLFVVYIPREIGLLFIDPKEKKRVENKDYFEKKLSSDLIELLIKEKIIITHNYNEYEESYILGKKLEKKQPLNIMYLLLTDSCNFKCRYCFEEIFHTAPYVSKKMTKETADKAIKKFAELRKKYGNNNIETIINLYGGEPLLNKDVIYFAITTVNKMIAGEKLPQNTQIVLTTNGSLITNKLAKFLSQHKVSVGLSIDGPIEYNDRYRISKNNKSAFELAYEGYKILKQNKVQVGISFTITPEALDEQEAIIDFLINKIGVENGLGFNLLHYNIGIVPDESYYKEASKFIIKSFEKFRKINIYEDRIMRKVIAFSRQRPIYADCGIVGSQIVISPDGKIGICQDFIKQKSYFYGSVHNSNYDPIKNNLHRDWAHRSPLFTKECQECEAIAICGGGCPASVENETGNKWNIDKRFCPHSKITLNWLIWDTYSSLSRL